jgi:uncharacterized protein
MSDAPAGATRRPAGARLRALLLALGLAAATGWSGCGDGDPAAATTPAPQRPKATPTATATVSAGSERVAIEHPAVRRMPTLVAGSAQGSLPAPRTPGIGDAAFIRAAFDSAQRMWSHEFQQASLDYRPARLVFFGAQVHTACGVQGHEVGPFYCPADHTAYINTGFFDALGKAYGLSSGFASGYVVAHEVGHHVQQLLDVHERVALADRGDPANANARSVRVELQADCYAGLWLHTVAARDQLGAGDLADILSAAAIVGDDYQQRRATGTLAPETWTHGSSAQRQHWLGVGLERGRPQACDTFSDA